LNRICFGEDATVAELLTRAAFRMLPVASSPGDKEIDTTAVFFAPPLLVAAADLVAA
jgi:hypothetical protein